MGRLHGWAVCCVVAAAALAAARADDDWTGKRVMTRKSGQKITTTDESGRDVDVAVLDEMVYTVEEAKGKFIKLRQRGVAGWIARDDLVRIEDAVDYFTDEIRNNPNNDSNYGNRAWRARRRATSTPPSRTSTTPSASTRRRRPGS